MEKQTEKKLTASAVMMLIGTAFIVLSAVTFVAANWVKLPPEGKVFALAGASVMALAVSAAVKAAAKLEKTSIAFYIIGSAAALVSFYTAAYYEKFGSWFTSGADGAPLLYCVLSVGAAIAFFIGYPIYKGRGFLYAGLSMISIALMFGCIQITDNLEEFSPVIIMVQFVITATIHLLKPQKDTFMERPVKVVGDITAVFYAFLAGCYVLNRTFHATPYSFFVLGVILVQLFVYGTFMKQKWMYIFMNIVGIYTAFTAVCAVEDKFGEDFIMLLFAFITLVIYLANSMIPKNLTAAKAAAFVFAMLGAVISLCADNEHLFGVNAIVPIVMSVSIVMYGFHKEQSIRIVAALASPILPFMTAIFLNNRLHENFSSIYSRDIETLVYGTLVLFYMAVTAVCIFMPKSKDKSTEIMPYVNMVCSAAILLNITGYSQLFMVTIALCIFHFILSYFMSCNITAAASIGSFVLISTRVLQHYLGKGSDAGMYIMFGIFAILMVISRLLFTEKFAVVKDGKTLIDVIILSAWTAVLPFPIFNRVSFFLRLMAIAIFTASFIKKKTDRDTAAVLLSVSALIAAFAFMTRPFLTPDSSMIASKINLAILALLGAACRCIWQNHKLASRVASTIIFVISFAGLIVDSMIFHNVFNKIFVLVITAGILIFAFFTKSKTWFTASSIALVVITVFSTWRYFDAMGWWLYLFAVGVVLIAIASINEACKKKGETVRSTVSKTFSDWTW